MLDSNTDGAEDKIPVEHSDFMLFQKIKILLERIDRELRGSSHWTDYRKNKPKEPLTGKRSRDGKYTETETESEVEVNIHHMHFRDSLIACGEDLKKVDDWIQDVQNLEVQDVLTQWYYDVEGRFFKCWKKLEDVLSGRAE